MLLKNQIQILGYITHVEKGDRIPSQNALKKICTTLDIPFQQLAFTYNKVITEDQQKNDFLNYIPYDLVPAVSKVDDLIKCPSKFGTASFAFKVPDNSMETKFFKNSYVYVEQNSLPAPREFGLFYYNGKLLIRKLLFSNHSYVLKPLNDKFNQITINKTDSFYIIGKILGTYEDFKNFL